MRRRSRTRWVLKWAGTVGCLLIAALWALSYSGYTIAYVDQPYGTAFLTNGRICQPFSGVTPSNYQGPLGWTVFRPGERPFAIDDIYLALWLPMVLIAVPTAFLWFTDVARWLRDFTRTPPGHCRRCGYDLTGNVSGTCPECGEAVGAIEWQDA